MSFIFIEMSYMSNFWGI